MFWYNLFAVAACGMVILVFWRQATRQGFWGVHAIVIPLIVFVVSRYGAYALAALETGVWTDDWLGYVGFRRGGMSLYGGFYLALLTIFLYCRATRLSFAQVLDALAPAAALGFAVGRLGCLFAGCCRGPLMPLSWALPTFIPQHAFFPAPILASAANLGIGSVLLKLDPVRRGWRTGWFFLLYGSARFLIELARSNPVVAGGLTSVQWLSLPLTVVGVVVVLRQRRRRAGEEFSAPSGLRDRTCPNHTGQ